MAPVPVIPQLLPALCRQLQYFHCAVSHLPGSATPWKCDSPKHPEADVAVASHPGLILNCAVFLSKLHGHLLPPGDR